MRPSLSRLVRQARRRAGPILLLASVIWVAASLLVAVQHGAHRRRTFNGSEHGCGVQASQGSAR